MIINIWAKGIYFYLHFIKIKHAMRKHTRVEISLEKTRNKTLVVRYHVALPHNNNYVFCIYALTRNILYVFCIYVLTCVILYVFCIYVLTCIMLRISYHLVELRHQIIKVFLLASSGFSQHKFTTTQIIPHACLLVEKSKVIK